MIVVVWVGGGGGGCHSVKRKIQAAKGRNLEVHFRSRPLSGPHTWPAGTWEELLPTDAHRQDPQVVHGCGPGAVLAHGDVQVVLLSTHTSGTVCCCSVNTHTSDPTHTATHW